MYSIEVLDMCGVELNSFLCIIIHNVKIFEYSILSFYIFDIELFKILKDIKLLFSFPLVYYHMLYTFDLFIIPIKASIIKEGVNFGIPSDIFNDYLLRASNYFLLKEITSK